MADEVGWWVTLWSFSPLDPYVSTTKLFHDSQMTVTEPFLLADDNTHGRILIFRTKLDDRLATLKTRLQNGEVNPVEYADAAPLATH